jgi:serine/threonine-protein kinase
MVMVYVPEGIFKMGGSGGGSPYEGPLHAVTLDAYWIDQTEVTNAMYALCAGAGVCQPPSNYSSRRQSSYYGDPQFADYPVIWVDWTSADAYCSWAGARLPTEAEWEKAARGTDERGYPWGNSPASCSLGNFVLEMSDFNVASGECVGDTNAVGSYLPGASPYGALDLAGNVREWVNDWFDGTYYSVSADRNPQGPTTGTYRVVRGSSWSSHLWYVRSTVRGWLSPEDRDLNVGFRCARDTKP